LIRKTIERARILFSWHAFLLNLSIIEPALCLQKQLNAS